MHFKNILIPFDGSNLSKKAMTTAMDLAQKYNAKTYVLTCIGNFYTGRWYLDNRIAEEQFAKEYATAKNELKKIKEQANNQDVSAKIDIARSDDVVKKIADYVKKHKIDLIVIGSHGRTGLNKLLLGSKAQGTIQNVKCPVLIIK